MTRVVFLQGANLGNRRFKPAELAKELADLDLTNLGAAGTFVVRATLAERALRKRLQDAIPFEAPMIVCDADELQAALAAGESIEVPAGAKRFATVLERAPAKAPKLPFAQPDTASWGLRFEAMAGRFALGVRRRMDEGGVYPHEVVEKLFGDIVATTRDWPTMEKIGKLLG